MSDLSERAHRARPLLDVDDLQVFSKVKGARKTIVSGISFSVGRGEIVGIVGESGSGKSISMKAVMGLLPRGIEHRGRVVFDGLDLSNASDREWRDVRGKRIARLPQDPFTMLNPYMRCGTQILGDGPLALSTAERRQRQSEIRKRMAEVGIADEAVAGRYPFQLSGGLRQRVGIAAALAQDPALLIADEPSTALDATTQARVFELFADLRARRRMSMVLITHDLRVAFDVCDRVFVLYAGQILESGPSQAMEAEPLHPYTAGLFLSEPNIERKMPSLDALPGNVPDPDDVKEKCALCDRCKWHEPACEHEKPKIVRVDEGRYTKCRRITEIRASIRQEISTFRGAGGAVVSIPGRASLARVRDLSKVYGRGTHAVEAVKGVSLDVSIGECVALVGESGAGKTTVGRCVVGLEQATSGTIELAGDASHRIRPDLVQMVFQDPYSTLDPVMSIGRTLTSVCPQRMTPKQRRSWVGERLEEVGLSSKFADRRPAALSGGERQRVAIARALAANPRLVVCDEPVSALDVSVQAHILALLDRLRRDRGVAYLFVTHDLCVVRQLADRVYVMKDGEVVEHGTCDQVLDNPRHPYTIALRDAVPGASREKSSKLRVQEVGAG